MTTHLLLEELGVDYDVSWFNVHLPETDLNAHAHYSGCFPNYSPS